MSRNSQNNALTTTSILVITALLATISFAAEPQSIVVRYRQGLRGYEGTSATTIRRHTPDSHFGGWERFSIGRRQPREGSDAESVALIKFTDLNLPPGSRILDARLVLYCVKYGTHQPSRASVHALLKDFAVADHEGPASPGQTTWHAARHNRQPWSAPGATATTDQFIFDDRYDSLATPDDNVTIDNRGRFTFDVTRSFTQQLENEKFYGWLIREVTGSPLAYAHFATERAPLSGSPMPTYPELVLTLIPPTDDASIRPSLGPHLLAFYLGYHHEIVQNIDRLTELPFDGAVFFGQSNTRHPDGRGWISNSVFGPDKLAFEDYTDFITDMKKIQQTPSPLQHNFLRVNLVPGTLVKLDQPYTWELRPRRGDPVTMWFDDGFDIVTHNLAVAARVARHAGMRGLLLDWEQYAGGMLNYADQKDAHDHGKSLDQTRRAVRQRTEQLAHALNAEFPDMTLLIIPATYHQSDHHNLLNSFMDGFFAVADPRMRIVDGNEHYGNTTLQDFQRSYNQDYREIPSLSAVPDKYLQHIEVGFGVWLERHGWSADPAVNNWSAARWQVVLENALVTADTYVWIFNGEGGEYQPEWLTGENLPYDYIQATIRALNLSRRIRGFTPDH